MKQLAQSIKENGVLTPCIVRPSPYGDGYELLSGHRRVAACRLIGRKTIPAIVRDLDNDAAIILMVGANQQRENFLPSEKAFAYRMKLEAMKHQGKRTDLTSPQVAAKSRTDDQIAKSAKVSGDIQDFHQSIFDEGHTPNTVIHYHAVLRRALQNAVKKEIIGSNPADRVDRPKKNVYHAQFYSAEEMMALFDAVSDDPLEICVKLAAYYGLRRSEVLGLKWDAINLEQKTISIKHKVIEDTVDGKSIAVGEDVLKTKSSFRTLPLLPSVEKLLLAEKGKQEMYRKLFKRSYCRDYLDYICLDQTGKLMRPNYVTDHFSWVLEKAGLKKIRFHDLRHSCASLLLANGISMKQIQIWLGHSTFSTTADIYSHLDFHAQIQSVLVMDGMFERNQVAEPTGLAAIN